MVKNKVMIVNKTKKTTISKNFEFCDNVFSKAKGLMFQMKFKTPLVFVFDKENKHGLHMLFVFFPIDVIFLNKSKRVVDLKESFQPFTFYTPKEKCKYAIELREGAIKRTRTKMGQKIDFE